MSIRDVEAPERPVIDPDAPDTPVTLPAEPLPDDEPAPQPLTEPVH